MWENICRITVRGPFIHDRNNAERLSSFLTIRSCVLRECASANLSHQYFPTSTLSNCLKYITAGRFRGAKRRDK